MEAVVLVRASKRESVLPLVNIFGRYLTFSRVAHVCRKGHRLDINFVWTYALINGVSILLL